MQGGRTGFLEDELVVVAIGGAFWASMWIAPDRKHAHPLSISLPHREGEDCPICLIAAYREKTEEQGSGVAATQHQKC
jgi:hypothetical protein